MKGLFVTGTDTGVGKSLVAAALLRAFGRAGAKAVGMKPVAAGAVRTDQGWRNDDVDALVSAGNVDAPVEAVNPYCFEPPIAPHLAAREAGEAIDLDLVVQRFRTLAARAEVVVVEGAGGFLVPLNDRETLADLAVRLGLPVVLVVGMRLGCLNHALLTAEAIRSRGLPLAGWVANRTDPDMLRYDGNRDALIDRLGMTPLAEIPYLADPVRSLVVFDEFAHRIVAGRAEAQ